MAITYGLTAAGFVLKPQSVIIAEIESDLRSKFGQNIDLSPESNFGQFVGTESERYALLWELGLAVYVSQNPNGAEGTSVDNILALTNLRRLPATPTRTDLNPLTGGDGVTLYGLVLLGVPGTPIPSGSIIQTNQSPPLQFTIDSPVVIAAALNAIQSLFFSNSPTMGAYTLSINDTSDNILTTSSIPYNAQPNTSLVTFSGVPTTGAFKVTLSQAGAVLSTASLPFSSTASSIQAAVQALSGYGAVTVSGDFTAGFLFTWGAISNPLVTITASSLDATATSLDSVQAEINNLLDAIEGNYPYTDVVVTFSSAMVFTFGANTPLGSNPSSGAMQQSKITVPTNTMQNGSNVTNTNVTNTQVGAPAMAISSATCSVNGPNFVGAGTLNTIGSAVAGWNGVTNQLDCVSGTNIEDDTQALIRRTNDLQAQANGPLQAIIQKVSQVAGVSAVKGFENTTQAALQIITFEIQPSTGVYKLTVNGQTTANIAFGASSAGVQSAIRALTGYSTVLVAGDTVAGFTVDFNGSNGGQPQPMITIVGNTTGVAIDVNFGRPGKSFEIVVQGGTNNDIATAIMGSKPAGIQAYGSVPVTVFDQYGNAYNIGFSRPSQVPIYVTLTMVTDLTQNNPQFSPQSVQDIQQDIANLGNAVGIGGLIIGFGSSGLIGAFNSVPGIISYTMAFGRNPSPSTNTNIQMQSEEVPVFELFNIEVAYT